MWRFEGGPQRLDAPSQLWLSQPEPMTQGQGLGHGSAQGQGLGPGRTHKPKTITSQNSDNDFDQDHESQGQGQGHGQGVESGRVQGQTEPGQGLGKFYYNGIASITALWTKPSTPTTTPTTTATSTIANEQQQHQQQQQQQQQHQHQHQPQQEKVNIRMSPPSSKHGSGSGHNSGSLSVPPTPIEVAIMGGHMNNHVVGQMVLHRILGIASELGDDRDDEWVRITLIALPLVPDIITKQIAGKVMTHTAFSISNTSL